MLHVVLVQMGHVSSAKESFGKVESLLKSKNILPDVFTPQESPKNSLKGLIILPEMFATGFCPLQPRDFAEDFSNTDSGVTAQFLQNLASRTGYAIMGAGIQTDAQGHLFNHSSVYLPCSSIEFACYDKVQPFFTEQRSISPGQGINLFRITDSANAAWNVASTICFDLRFALLYHSAAKSGAQLVTVQASWPKSRIDHWETLLRARAIENQVYVAAVNEVSEEESSHKQPLGGTSMIISPKGEIITKGSLCNEEILEAELDLSLLEEYRKDFPVYKFL